MNKIFTTALLLLLSTAIRAQEFQLKGRVTAPDHQPMELVYVSLLKSDSTVAKRTLTDSLGRFALKAIGGTYRLILEETGTDFTAREIVLSQDTDLGEIVIKPAVALESVTITARKRIIEQKVDRLVFYVENSTAATGGTALDALKATPTVRVQNESISIAGKGEILVMVDDRLQRMSQEDLATFLKSIPADNIKSIEVISTPPAKYDAEGNSGLINIRLKKARANSWNANVGASYVQKTYAGGNVQGAFNYNRNKLSLQVSANTGRQKLLTDLTEKIHYPQELWDQQLKNKSVGDFLGLGFGADYKLTSKWTTGIRYLGNLAEKSAVNRPLTTRYNYAAQLVNSSIFSDVNTQNQSTMHTLNWYHALALDSSGKNLSLDFDYFHYGKKDHRFFSGNELDQNQNVLPNTFFSSTNTNLNRVSNYSAKADVVLPYKWANLSLGAKFSATRTNNDLAVYDHFHNGSTVLNTDQSNVFSYREFNEALYVSAGKKLAPKWETQLGLRMEATQTEGYSRNLDQRNRNRYIKLFPTAYLTYSASDKNNFSLNYSRRIRRPDFDYLNPFIIRTNPYSFSEGNPFLKPSFIDNLELSYIRNQKWVNSVYCSQITDFGQDLSITDPVTNITKQTPLNYANMYQLGISTAYNFSKFTWWNSYTGLNLNWQRIQSKTDFIASAGGINGNFFTNNDFTLNKSKTVLLGVNYATQLPGRYQIFEISTMHILDVSAKFLLLDKKLSLTLVAEDLFNGQRPLITYYSNGILNSIQSYGDTRGFRVSVNYGFGNNKLKVKDERGLGNGDERERVE